MEIDQIKSPNDILEFMKEKINYGWIDINGEKHIQTMKNFRRIYRTSSIDEVLTAGLGTCIEQVCLMHFLLDRLDISNKMYCCRIFEPDDYNNLEEEEHMHCFLLYFQDNKVYQIEHPNYERIGIYEYNSEDEALKEIVNYYITKSGGVDRPTTEFFDVPVHINFKEFNAYINNLNNNKKGKLK